MKKNAIITLYGEVNYGNRLQNYAVIKCFEKWGIQAETIVRRTFGLRDRCVQIRNKAACLLMRSYLKENRPDLVRTDTFQKFTRNYIPTIFYKKKAMPDLLKRYDYFVVGSDQVWNPCFSGFENIFDEMLLTDVPREKKMCIAPSFGVSQIPEEWEEKFAAALLEFPKLCAREESGAKIIHKLTGKDASVMIDPTLMLDAAEWDMVSKPIKNLSDRYILEYFLGTSLQEADKKLEELVQQYGEQRIRLLDKTNPDIYVSGPSEFLYLIKHSALVRTDSFHACVFSILYHKPFIVYRRQGNEKDMFSRIITLLELFEVSTDSSVFGRVIQVPEVVRDKVLSQKRKEMEQYFV